MTSKLGKKQSPMPLLRAFHHRPFMLLWSGQTVSLLGDSIYQVALAWWVLQKTGSAVAMGMVFLFSFTPMVVFLLIRVEKKRHPSNLLAFKEAFSSEQRPLYSPHCVAAPGL